MDSELEREVENVCRKSRELTIELVSYLLTLVKYCIKWREYDLANKLLDIVRNTLKSLKETSD